VRRQIIRNAAVTYGWLVYHREVIDSTHRGLETGVMSGFETTRSSAIGLNGRQTPNARRSLVTGYFMVLDLTAERERQTQHASLRRDS
jgi:hypothetical protein